ncbi:hypothetical protein MLD38_027847 [Melastoma candidum]|uniref:Uncharacterized protein n=1 Tax=Melastoma candidum TaxID=119954 RepID=A0ACB9P8Q2_9MYRT|nr:hypothetical protein MLD38_027847 [Melastoma candidum]
MNDLFCSPFLYILFLLSSVAVRAISGLCTCELTTGPQHEADLRKALTYKLMGIGSILVASTIGVTLPVLGKTFAVLHPENSAFFLIKSFAAGVILATGLVHILPDAFESLKSPSVKGIPWEGFPVAGFIVMLSMISTMVLEAFATGYLKRCHRSHGGIKEQPVKEEDEMWEGHLHVHTHASHGHAHGSTHYLPAPQPHGQELDPTDLVRHRVVSQVMELGIVVHSVIIGLSLGASRSAKTIKPLAVALTFHQLFEGMGLGGCISQANFKFRAVAAMVMFFCLTTPVGIAVGVAMTGFHGGRAYIIMEGVLNSASAGILICMALVDLIAADFSTPVAVNHPKLLLAASLSLILGAATMSLLSRWA